MFVSKSYFAVTKYYESSFISPVRRSSECLFISQWQPNKLLFSTGKKHFYFISENKMFNSWYLSYFTKWLLTELYFTASERPLAVGNILTRQCHLLWFLQYDVMSKQSVPWEVRPGAGSYFQKAPHWCQQKTMCCRVLPSEKPVRASEKKKIIIIVIIAVLLASPRVLRI